jgi:hypothetical protein
MFSRFDGWCKAFGNLGFPVLGMKFTTDTGNAARPGVLGQGKSRLKTRWTPHLDGYPDSLGNFYTKTREAEIRKEPGDG